MQLEGIARALIGLALLLLLAGGVLFALSRLGLTRLPGDIVIEGRNWKFFFPIVTSLVVSLVLTVLINVFSRFFK